MLEKFRAHLTVKRRAASTIRLRMVYMNQLAAFVPDVLTASPGDLEQFLAAHPDWKPETVNAATVTFRTFYKWAVKYGHRTDDPSVDLELAYVPRVVKLLADDDRINDSMPGATLLEQAMLRLGRECGLRRLEIASLHSDDRRGEWLTVTGKGGRVRRLKVNPTLAALLDMIEAAQGSGFYFRGGVSGHLHPNTVYNTVLRLTGTPTHALRRRAATSVYNGTGRNLRLTQEFLGHSSPNITAIYVDVNDDDLSAAADAAGLAA